MMAYTGGGLDRSDYDGSRVVRVVFIGLAGEEASASKYNTTREFSRLIHCE